MDVDPQLKQKYMDYYSQWIDIKYEKFDQLKRIPESILEFTYESPNVSLIPRQTKTSSGLLEHHQREGTSDNIRTAWHLLWNSQNFTFTHLQAANAWYELLNRYIQSQGLSPPSKMWGEEHLYHRLNQDQHNLLHELELALNPAIIGLIAIADKLAHVIVRTYIDLFPELNRYYCFVDTNRDLDIVLETRRPPDISAGNVVQTLGKNNQNGQFDKLLHHLNYFVQSDFDKLRKYRDSFVHGFGQRVGYAAQDIQYIYEYLDISHINKRRQEWPKYVVNSKLPLMAVGLQEWTHKDLLELTLTSWNQTIDVIEAVFKIIYKGNI